MLDDINLLYIFYFEFSLFSLSTLRWMDGIKNADMKRRMKGSRDTENLLTEFGVVVIKTRSSPYCRYVVFLEPRKRRFRLTTQLYFQ